MSAHYKTTRGCSLHDFCLLLRDATALGSVQKIYREAKQITKIKVMGASLVAQWLRICLPMQGTQVRALVWEDPTCHGATRPVSHNY